MRTLFECNFFKYNWKKKCSLEIHWITVMSENIELQNNLPCLHSYGPWIIPFAITLLSRTLGCINPKFHKKNIYVWYHSLRVENFSLTTLDLDVSFMLHEKYHMISRKTQHVISTAEKNYIFALCYVGRHWKTFNRHLILGD